MPHTDQEERRAFVFLRRKRGLSRARFLWHWSHRHGPLVAGRPEFWRYTAHYVQNHLLGAVRAPFDGIAVSTQRDPHYRGPGFPAERCYLEVVRPDEAKFMDYGSIVRRMGYSRTLRAGPATGRKLIVLGDRDLPLSLGRIARRAGLGRICVSRFDGPLLRISPLSPVATMAEIWIDAPASSRAALFSDLSPLALVSEVLEIEISSPA